MGELSIIIDLDKSLPIKDISFMNTLWTKVQCSLNSLPSINFFSLLSRMSIKGSAYLLKLAVYITISYILDKRLRNNSVPGLTKTKTLHKVPSMSTGRVISGLMFVLKLEWTRVSSRSSTRVFRPFFSGF